MMHIIEISTRKNLYVTVRTTKSFGGHEYSQTQAKTTEISARKIMYRCCLLSNPESTAKELPIDVRSMENGRELACGYQNV